MKKYFIAAITVFLVQTSFAQEPTVPEIHGRKGFFLGLGLGYGVTDSNDSKRNYDHGSYLGNLRIGGGITEKVILMAESSAAVSKKDDTTTTVSTTSFSAQVFLIDNFYFRPGVGFSVLEVSTETGNITITDTSDAGFGMLASAGYEWRIGRGFALSPEANYNFVRVAGQSISNYGGTLGMLWYF